MIENTFTNSNSTEMYDDQFKGNNFSHGHQPEAGREIQTELNTMNG